MLSGTFTVSFASKHTLANALHLHNHTMNAWFILYIGKQAQFEIENLRYTYSSNQSEVLFSRFSYTSTFHVLFPIQTMVDFVDDDLYIIGKSYRNIPRAKTLFSDESSLLESRIGRKIQ